MTPDYIQNVKDRTKKELKQDWDSESGRRNGGRLFHMAMVGLGELWNYCRQEDEKVDIPERTGMRTKVEPSYS